MSRSRILHHLISITAILNLSSTLYSQQILEEVAHLDINFGSGEYIHEIFTDNNLLFTLVGSHDDLSVGIFDVTDPESPLELGRKEGGRTYIGNPGYDARVIYLEETELYHPAYAILSDTGNNALHYFWHCNKAIRHNGLVYRFWDYQQEVRIYREVSPTEFSLIKTDTLNTHLSEISGLAIIGEVIYITTRYAGVYSGLILLDVSDPDSLVELESPITNEDLTGLVFGCGRALIGYDFRNILILDVSDPRKPAVAFTKSFSHTRLRGLWQNDQFYLRGACNISVRNRELEIRSEILTKGQIGSFTLNDTNLIASTNLGIEIYDVSDESDPILQSIYGANIAHPVKFCKQGNLLYVANLGDGLKIVDVLNSHQPTVIGGIDFNGHTTDVKVLGNYAYHADYVKGLIIIDVSQPNSPQVVSNLPIDGGAIALDLGDEEAFLINDQNELYVIDVSDKTQPEITYLKAIHPSYSFRFGSYKKITLAHGYIWLKFYEYPLYAYEYSSGTGISEIFRYDYAYSSAPREMKYIDNLLYLTIGNGIQIIDPNSLSFIKEEPFGMGLEWSPVAVALNRSDKILYVSLAVFGISGIRAYDMTTPENPKELDGYLGLWFAPKEMIFDDKLLYALTPEGVGIYSPSNAVHVRDVYATDIKAYDDLGQNHPNPFNPTTTLRYELSRASQVSLVIYDLLGREVTTLVDDYVQPGTHEAVWDADNLPSGIYIARLVTPEYSKAIKMVLLK